MNVSSNVTWSASDNTAWLSISPSGGINNGSITINYLSNSTTISRVGEVTVTDGSIVRTVTVTQEGKYTINLLANPSLGGNPSGGGSYFQGESITVSSNPESGYSFVNWTEGGSQVSIDENYTFTVSENRTLVANYSINQYTLVISKLSNGNGSVRVNGTLQTLPFTETYDYGDVVSLNAEPSTGSDFTSWGGDLSGTTASTSITMNGNKNVTASFALEQYTFNISKLGNGNGSVRVNGTLQTLPFTETYDYGDVVSLNAEPSTGSDFTSWGGDLSGTTASTSITMNDDKDVTALFTLEQYTLDISKLGNGNGSVRVNGTLQTLPFTETYDYGDVVSLNAEPSTGSDFTSWGGDLSGTTASTSITMNGNKNVTASFALEQYTFNISKLGNGNGSVRVNGTLQTLPFTETYDYGDVVSLNAEPSTGSDFTSWGGDLSGTTASTNITMNGDKDVTATFTLQQFTLSISSLGDGSGSVRINGVLRNLPYVALYNYGDNLSLNAEPSTGSDFTSWGGDLSGTNQSTSVEILSDNNITATFTLKSYTLNISLGGNGNGQVKVDGVTKSLPFTDTYKHGTSLNLEAIPEVGSEFSNWSGDIISTLNPITLTMDNPKDIVTGFTLEKYSLTLTKGGNGEGQVKVDNILRDLPYTFSYDYGSSVSLEAVETIGSDFVNWSGDLSGTTNPTIIIISSDVDIIVSFALEVYELSMNISPFESGSTSGQGTYEYGTTATIQATPATGYTFTNWSGDINSTDNPESIVIDSDKNVTANFVLNTYNVQISSSPLDGGTASGEGIYNHGDEVQLHAQPATGRTFLNWSENGSVISTDSNYSFIISGDRNLIANFKINEYTLATSSSPAEGGTTTGAGTFNHGTLRSVSATPTTGWNFNNWKENDIVVSNSEIYSFIILGNRDLTAFFSKKIYLISTAVNPTEAGTTNGDGNYSHDSTVVLNAAPNIGWEFMNWTEGEDIVFTSPNITFKATGHRTLTANFQKKTYSITTAPNNEIGGATFGDSIITHGDQLTVSAVADSVSGYDFIHWTENDLVVSTNSYYTFTVTGPRNLIAVFQLRSYNVDLLINPENAGTFNGSGTYTHGDSVEITAIPEAGWLFANWTENNLNVSNFPIYKFMITDDKTFTANFAHELYNIGANSAPVEAGVVSGAGAAFYGQTITIIATPNIGWQFDDWTENGNVISNNLAYEFTVDGDRNFIANFSHINYSIVCSGNPVEGGSTSGCGSAHYGDEMTLTAIPNNGWEFINWTENDNIVSTSSDYTFTVERDRVLIANFDLPTSIERLNDNDIIPKEYYLSNAYPNPFNPETNIRFGLPESSEVNILVFDVSGRLIKILLDKVSLPAGNYETKYNAINTASGIYFYRIVSFSLNSDKQFSKVGKFILIK